MKPIAQALSGLALLGTFLPACLFAAGWMSLSTVKHTMLVSMLVWFAATPWWMERRGRGPEAELGEPGSHQGLQTGSAVGE